MSGGGYRGGSTIISVASLWRDERQRERDANGEPSTVGWGKARKSAEAKAASRAVDRERTADDLASKRTPKPATATHKIGKKLTQRGAMLKAQVAAGILLPTGKPNPEHPANQEGKAK